MRAVSVGICCTFVCVTCGMKDRHVTHYCHNIGAVFVMHNHVTLYCGQGVYLIEKG